MVRMRVTPLLMVASGAWWGSADVPFAAAQNVAPQPVVSQSADGAPAQVRPTVTPTAAVESSPQPVPAPPAELPKLDAAPQPPAPPPAPPFPKPKAAPAPAPFALIFANNDFRYKRNPNHPYIFGEEFKDVPLEQLTGAPIFDDTTISSGGELRFRYIDEINRLRPGGPGHTSYDQWRWRHYVDLRHSDFVRAYVELIDASTNHANLPLAGIDKNRWDLQNYFGDVRVGEFDDHPIWFRVGRQELSYGVQRLVSPLDWANTRRNFEGLKLFTQQEDWDLDFWIVNPVNTATPNAGSLDKNDNAFDHRNEDYLFGGGYFSYRGWQDQTLDLFFLYANQNFPVTGYPFGDRYTLGGRWLGNHPTDDGDHVFHAEVEGGIQFGNDRSALYDPASPRAEVLAGYVTAGVGHTWKSLPWQPNMWLYYDWASGDNDPTDNRNNTFFQHFGLVHAYLGLIDNIARQNIGDVNTRLTLKPDPKLQIQFAHHWFQLANTHDVLYNVTGAPIGTPNNGSSIGQEFDFLMTYNVNANWSLEMGSFWFWYGDYIQNVSPRNAAQQVYVMSTFRY